VTDTREPLRRLRSAFKAACAYKLACSLYVETQNKGCTRGFQRGNHPSAAKEEEVELELLRFFFLLLLLDGFLSPLQNQPAMSRLFSLLFLTWR
jgi:hypothetical protein